MQMALATTCKLLLGSFTREETEPQSQAWNPSPSTSKLPSRLHLPARLGPCAETLITEVTLEQAFLVRGDHVCWENCFYKLT